MGSPKNFFKTYDFRRKLFHITAGLFFVIVINQELLGTFLPLVLLFALIGAIMTSILAKYYKVPFILDFLEIFDKPQDLLKFPARGAIYYVIGVLATVMIFDKDVACASILILTFGDPVSFFIGKYYGKRKLAINRKKQLEGTLAGTFIGTIGATLFVPFPISFFGAAFGMIAEAVEFEYLKLDDNFFIPFVSGIVMISIKAML